jgi:uncharacterized integral membrane protein (TIGR00698 family)
LLRLGIILLGVRLNLDLVVHGGWKILFLDMSVIITGLCFITWLGTSLGLDSTLACLIAVDSSICGASAVAAAAPVLRARDDETALVIPLCSLIGTIAVLAFTFAQGMLHLAPQTYGMLTGATLHEVAQVMAAVTAVPGALEMGTVTKLTRVVLLAPAIFFLNGWVRRSKNGRLREDEAGTPLPKPWFVLGFLLVGIANTLAFHLLPLARETLLDYNRQILVIANFLMAMAMAGMGLQVDFGRLRANGPRAVITAVTGWLLLLTLAIGETWLLAKH